MKPAVKVLPNWIGKIRQNLEKKDVKKVLRSYYGDLCLNDAYIMSENYAQLMGYKENRTFLTFKKDKDGIDQMGDREIMKMDWGMIVFLSLLKGAIESKPYLDILVDLHSEYIDCICQSRIAEYAITARQNAMMLYYGKEAESKILTPEQAIQLTARLMQYIMIGVSVKEFLLNDNLEIKIELEDETDRPEQFHNLKTWILLNLFAKRFDNEQIRTNMFMMDLFTILNCPYKEFHRSAVFYLTFYLIGLNDLHGIPIFIPGEIETEWAEFVDNSLTYIQDQHYGK